MIPLQYLTDSQPPKGYSDHGIGKKPWQSFNQSEKNI